MAESPLKAFIRACLRARWEQGAMPAAALDAARAIAAAGSAAWEALPQAAAREGVGPLLYAVTRGQRLPEAVEEALARQYWSSAARATLLYHELEGVLRALDEAGVRSIVLKGAALGQVVYRNIALRPMLDLDLLIEQHDAPATLRVLAALGYQRQYAEFRGGYELDYRKEVHYQKPGQAGVLVDLHWRLFDSLHHQRVVPMDWFWETAVPLQVGPSAAWTLGIEAQLLYLCAHVMQHGGPEKGTLIWLHDVGEVVACHGPQLDWDELLSRAVQYDLVYAVQHVLGHVAEVWGVPVPAEVLARLRGLAPSRAEKRVFGLRAGAYPAVAYLWVRLAGLSWRERLRYLRTTVFPSPAYMRARYHVRHTLLLPLCYARRLMRGFQPEG